jgi:hypothetical protein
VSRSVSARAHSTSRRPSVGCPGLGQAGEREALRHPAAAEPGELREHELHPVGALLAVPQLGQRLVVGLGLGVEEPLEVVGHTDSLAARDGI